MKESKDYECVHVEFIGKARQACNDNFVGMFIGKARQAYFELEKYERAKIKAALFSILIEKHYAATTSCIACQFLIYTIQNEDRIIELLTDVVQFTKVVRNIVVNKYAGEFISDELKAAVFYGYLLGKAGTHSNMLVTTLEEEIHTLDCKTGEDI